LGIIKKFGELGVAGGKLKEIAQSDKVLQLVKA